MRTARGTRASGSRATTRGMGSSCPPRVKSTAGNGRTPRKTDEVDISSRTGTFSMGPFVKGLAQGHGVYWYRNWGNAYSGNWVDDKKSGKGTYVFGTGSRYDGWWRENDIDGKGIFQYRQGDSYRGEFRRNRKHGQGIYKWSTGQCLQGRVQRRSHAGRGRDGLRDHEPLLQGLVAR